MAVTTVPDLTDLQNKGFVETSTEPVIHSIRWRHLASRKVFTDVREVISYHEQGSLVIDIKAHNVSYLDLYFLKSADLAQVRVYLRYVRTVDGILVEEPYTVGELGKVLTLEDDPINESLRRIRGIAFTQKDLGDGTPMYNFLSMANEGVYEVWVKAVDKAGNELHLRVPFQWSNLVSGPPTGGGNGGEGKPPAQEDRSPKLEHYDEFYVTVVEGDSAFTKRPSTQFRLAGIGMLQTPYCFERILTPKQAPITKPLKVGT